MRTKYIKQFKGDEEKGEYATLKHLKELDMMLPMSLHRHLEISQAEFHSIMQKCGIMKNESFKKESFQNFLSLHNLEADIEQTQPKWSLGKRYYIRLGHKTKGYLKDVKLQIKKQKYQPPRLNSISNARKAFHIEFRRGLLRETPEAAGQEPEAAREPEAAQVTANKKEQGQSSLAVDESATKEGNNTTVLSYPIISSLCIDQDKLSSSVIELLIGELISMQRQRNETLLPSSTEKTTRKKKGEGTRTATTFSYRINETYYNAVPIPLHKSQQAYLDYVKKKDYPTEIINEMGKSRNRRIAPNPKVGAKRLLHKVAKDFPDEYMEVGQEKGFNLGIIDAVSLAAWQEDTGIKDWQMVRSLKHLRHNLKGKVSVPFIHTKKFSEGYVQPKVKKFEHQYEKSGEIVSIECWYQDVDKMAALLIGDKLTELQLKPTDVKSIDFILGGDHGKDAFRFCFRAVIALDDDKMHYIDYGGAGTVFGKDTCEVLEKSIMPWLTEDLKRIHQCQLVIEEPDEDGKIVCAFLEATDNVPGNGNASRKKITEVHKSERMCDVPGKYVKRKRGDAITPSPPRRTITRNLSPTQDLQMCSICLD